jgi:hypothetical protein
MRHRRIANRHPLNAAGPIRFCPFCQLSMDRVGGLVYLLSPLRTDLLRVPRRVSQNSRFRLTYCSSANQRVSLAVPCVLPCIRLKTMGVFCAS